MVCTPPALLPTRCLPPCSCAFPPGGRPGPELREPGRSPAWPALVMRLQLLKLVDVRCKGRAISERSGTVLRIWAWKEMRLRSLFGVPRIKSSLPLVPGKPIALAVKAPCYVPQFSQNRSKALPSMSLSPSLHSSLGPQHQGTELA